MAVVHDGHVPSSIRQCGRSDCIERPKYRAGPKDRTGWMLWVMYCLGLVRRSRSGGRPLSLLAVTLSIKHCYISFQGSYQERPLSLLAVTLAIKHCYIIYQGSYQERPLGLLAVTLAIKHCYITYQGSYQERPLAF